MARELISAIEAAEILKLKVTTFYGMVKRGEVQPVGRHETGDEYQFDRTQILKLRKELPDKPLARDGSTRGRPRKRADNETVRAFGRVTPEEMARWTKAAKKSHGGKVWPWLRDLANKAADKAGV